MTAAAFLDPLLACSALVVESNDAPGRAAHVGDYKADTRIEFARMPFDLGDDPARLRPASDLIGEIGVIRDHPDGRSPTNRHGESGAARAVDCLRRADLWGVG